MSPFMEKELETLHPFMASELGSRFSLSIALRQGLLPLVWGVKQSSDITDISKV